LAALVACAQSHLLATSYVGVELANGVGPVGQFSSALASSDIGPKDLQVEECAPFNSPWCLAPFEECGAGLVQFAESPSIVRTSVADVLIVPGDLLLIEAELLDVPRVIV